MVHLKDYVETGLVVSKVQSGRPKLTTPSEYQYMQLCSQRQKRNFITDTQFAE